MEERAYCFQKEKNLDSQKEPGSRLTEGRRGRGEDPRGDPPCDRKENKIPCADAKKKGASFSLKDSETGTGKRRTKC